MCPTGHDSHDIAVLAPTGRDTALICALLTEHGMSARGCLDAAALAERIEQGIGLAIVTEEALSPPVLATLEAVLSRQPAWSDLPFVLMSGHGVAGAVRPVASLERLGNVTMLDRPVQTRTLLSAVRAALRAREKQYDAAQAIELRDRFLAMLGHELRNPLAAIVFATERLSRADEAAPRQKHLALVHRQTRLLSRLVDDLLDVSRVTRGKISLSRTTADLREVVQVAVTALEPWATARRMTVRCHFDPAPVWVDADVLRLEQVSTNLLTNAVKYTPEGGTIDVTVRAGGERGCELVVADDGIGIAAQSLGTIFEAFIQVDARIDRSQGGLGLGLTLVRALVELHGGHVTAQSPGLGQGSTFTVTLPPARQPGVLAAPEERHPRHGASLSIVVVEDNADLRELLAEQLVEEGHRVTSAAEGTRGLELIVKSKPDVALVDIGLPGLDGYAVAEAVRHQLGRAVRMVALSGYGQPEDQARALRAGFDAHLTKPVDLDMLNALMTEP
ncbi:MAG: response regulator [Archangiaceae bacterium]|nr:response regulator [Archangiaceae bacterium]